MAARAFRAAMACLVNPHGDNGHWPGLKERRHGHREAGIWHYPSGQASGRPCPGGSEHGSADPANQGRSASEVT